MRAIAAIAWNTFREAVRNRILYIILIFAVLLIASAGIVSDLAIAAHGRVVRDFGLTCINFFGLAIAIIVGIGLVYNELDKKSIYTIVSKPIARWQFLLGKYFGLLLTIYVNVLVMTVFFLSVTHYLERTHEDVWDTVLFAKDASGAMVPVAHPKVAVAKYIAVSVAKSGGLAVANLFGFAETSTSSEILWVVFFSALEMAIVTSFAVLYSSFSTPTLSAIFTILTFIAGRLNHDIWSFAQRILNAESLKEDAPVAASKVVVWLNNLYPFGALPLFATFGAWLKYWFAMLACAVVPNLGAFEQRTLSLTTSERTYAMSLWPTMPYSVAYTATILMLSILIFRSRNFK